LKALEGAERDESRRKSRFTEDQITMALRRGEAGTPIEKICRKMGISEGPSEPLMPRGHLPLPHQSANGSAARVSERIDDSEP
jgi:hypothetical protein